MDTKSLRLLKAELEFFLTRYLPLFGGNENSAHARMILHGLLAEGDRRNVENTTEAIDGASSGRYRNSSPKASGRTKPSWEKYGDTSRTSGGGRRPDRR